MHPFIYMYTNYVYTIPIQFKYAQILSGYLMQLVVVSKQNLLGSVQNICKCSTVNLTWKERLWHFGENTLFDCIF